MEFIRLMAQRFECFALIILVASTLNLFSITSQHNHSNSSLRWCDTFIFSRIYQLQEHLTEEQNVPIRMYQEEGPKLKNSIWVPLHFQ